MEIFAWFGEDASGDFGIKCVQGPGSAWIAACVASERRLMELPRLIAALQEEASRSGKPLRLYRFESMEEIRTINPEVVT